MNNWFIYLPRLATGSFRFCSFYFFSNWILRLQTRKKSIESKNWGLNKLFDCFVFPLWCWIVGDSYILATQLKHYTRGTCLWNLLWLAVTIPAIPKFQGQRVTLDMVTYWNLAGFNWLYPVFRLYCRTLLWTRRLLCWII